MSFAEWTATSIRPSSSASSISLTKTPRSPISPNGLVRSRSPAVVIGTSAISSPAAQRRGELGLGEREPSAAGTDASSTAADRSHRAATAPNASAPDAAPRRRALLLVLEAEQVPHGVRVATPSAAAAACFMRTVGRCSSLLRICAVTDSTVRRSLSDRAPGGSAPSRARRADLLGARAQRRDRRHDVERRLPGAEAVGLLGDDRLGALGLAPPAGEGLGDDRLEIVDVVEVAAVELVHGRVDVARDGEVDEEQRPALAAPARRRAPVSDEPAARSSTETTTSAAASSSASCSSASGLGAEALRELPARSSACGSRRTRSWRRARRGCGRRARRPCRRRRAARGGPSRSPNTCCASAAAADETDAGLSPIAVSRAHPLAGWSAWRKTRSSSGPGAPASYAARTWPRISPRPARASRARPRRGRGAARRPRRAAGRARELALAERAQRARAPRALVRRRSPRGRARCGCRSRGRRPRRRSASAAASSRGAPRGRARPARAARPGASGARCRRGRGSCEVGARRASGRRSRARSRRARGTRRAGRASPLRSGARGTRRRRPRSRTVSGHQRVEAAPSPEPHEPDRDPEREHRQRERDRPRRRAVERVERRARAAAGRRARAA